MSNELREEWRGKEHLLIVTFPLTLILAEPVKIGCEVIILSEGEESTFVRGIFWLGRLFAYAQGDNPSYTVKG